MIWSGESGLDWQRKCTYLWWDSTTESNQRGFWGDGQKMGNLNCVTKHQVGSSRGTWSRDASAATGKCWGQGNPEDKSDGGDTHAVQRGLHNLSNRSREPPSRQDFHPLTGGDGVVDQESDKLRLHVVSFMIMAGWNKWYVFKEYTPPND